MKFLAVLGRQPKLSLAELESLFNNVRQIGPELAVFESEQAVEMARLGGSLKIAQVIDGSVLDFLQKIPAGKITLGLSDYSRGASARQSGQEALKLKKILARHGRSVRVLQNKGAVLSTATSHHNQIGENAHRIELIKVGKEYFSVTGVQNITAYARRDQARPARDAKVGMLPPKLAQILLNLCGQLPEKSRVLDPFCGTGVVLQEALLMNYKAYGTDLSERMVDYSRKNLLWLENGQRSHSPEQNVGKKHNASDNFLVEVGDATNFIWQGKIDAVAGEIYLGRPMSNPPVEIKLKTEKQECGSILLGFLKNLSAQIDSGTPLALATPAWLRPDGSYSRLNLLDEIEKLGYNVMKFNGLSQKDLLYYREGQVVAREIIVLRKK